MPAQPVMQWASVIATERALTEAVAQGADRLLEALGGREPDLVLVFVANHYGAHFVALPGLLRREFENATLFGCIGASVIGGGRECEEQPAIAFIGAVLPDVQIHGVHLDKHTTPPTYAERKVWESALQLSSVTPDCLLLLADAFSFPSEGFLKGLDRSFPQTAKLGGLASGMEQADTPCLLFNETVYRNGVIVLALTGNLKVDTLVAQGCRPIGLPMFANSTHENLVLELDGKVPREVLTELYATLSRADRKLFTDALFLGVAMESQREQYQAGDFLVRTILGLDPQSGALWVNSHVPTHSVVQLHLRDAQTSAYDLEQLLRRYRAAPESRQAAGAVLLSCFGRGAQLYGHPDHDSNAFKQYLGDVPLAGFFSNGEIGPVNGVTHLHSYTSVFGVFRQK
jgi:small ligand-binding sensory domain FIST